MYGLVNCAIEDLVTQVGGVEAWQTVKTKVGFDDPAFVKMQSYPDQLTYSLVGAASDVLDTPANEILRAFGKHWTLYTAREGYGGLLDLTGQNLKDFLSNLNHMHSQMASTMPELTPPSFEIEEDAETGIIRVHYYSKRDGLAPMVLGLLEGLTEKFNEPAEVLQVGSTAQGDTHDIFEIRPR